MLKSYSPDQEIIDNHGYHAGDDAGRRKYAVPIGEGGAPCAEVVGKRWCAFTPVASIHSTPKYAPVPPGMHGIPCLPSSASIWPGWWKKLGLASPGFGQATRCTV
jgi:hypothetical protein